MDWCLGSFGDLRLDKRGAMILEQMVARKTVCLRQLGGSRRGELEAGRFFANRKVTAAKIVESWSNLTGPACAGRHILAIQDRSEVKYPTTAQRRRGLGPIGKGNIYGVLVHAMLAVDADSGACLGLLGGDVWTRLGVNPTPHRQRALEERESVHWVKTAQQAKPVLSAARQVTVVADREADMYPMWALVPEAKFHLLIRARKDRLLAGGGHLFEAPAKFRRSGRRRLELPARQPEQAKRTAVVELRYGKVEIRRPQDEDPSLPAQMPLRLVEVKEVRPPKDVEPLHWRLLTTHEIADAEAAWQIVEWYQKRWVIEQLFRVMKSQGLQLEDSQLASAERLVKLGAVATKAACIDIQLTQERDGKHQLPASTVFTEPEIDTLAALCPTLEGKVPRQQNPFLLFTLAWAAWIIARLGGWNCYYKPPGPITFRRGMQRFYDIHRGRELEMRLKREVRLP